MSNLTANVAMGRPQNGAKKPSERPGRAADFQTESLALGAPAAARGHGSDQLFDKRADTALATCRAQWAGVSLIEPGGHWAVFHGRPSCHSRSAGSARMPSQIVVATLPDGDGER